MSTNPTQQVRLTAEQFFLIRNELWDIPARFARAAARGRRLAAEEKDAAGKAELLRLADQDKVNMELAASILRLFENAHDAHLVMTIPTQAIPRADIDGLIERFRKIESGQCA